MIMVMKLITPMMMNLSIIDEVIKNLDIHHQQTLFMTKENFVSIFISKYNVDKKTFSVLLC
jgi:hypothetical protein